MVKETAGQEFLLTTHIDINILRSFFLSGLGWHLPGLSEVPS